MHILALYNIKGGVGKTAAAVNLAYLAARESLHTLLCDLDPQGSATYYFRIQPPKKLKAKKLAKGGKALDKNIKETDYENLHLLPADLSYRSLDIIFNDLKHSKRRLRDILTPLEEEYDLIILDCPPNLTLESENVFRAADIILVPFVPTTLSHVGLQKIDEFMQKKEIDTSRVYAFFSMVEMRKKMHKEMMEKMSTENNHFLQVRIPYTADVEKMGVTRKPLVANRPKAKASVAFKELWNATKNLFTDLKTTDAYTV
jgi:cellulose biosynthesis protein BcsQ